MAHIHELIDFVTGVYIVHAEKVLLIHHKKLKMWLSIGGHIELDEDPDQALMREIKEECGLKVEIIGEKPKISSKIYKFLYLPQYLHIHKINDTHKHIALDYFAKSKSDKVKLNAEEHNDIRWFTEDELYDEKYKIDDGTKLMAKKALEMIKF
jgi:8-oxo-dGTP pyrophosphatase MutT (NUDIX family)